MDKVSRLHFPSPFLYSLPIPIPGFSLPLRPRPLDSPPSPPPRRHPVSCRFPYSRLFLRTYEYLYGIHCTVSFTPVSSRSLFLSPPPCFSSFHPFPPSMASRRTRGRRSLRIWWSFYSVPAVLNIYRSSCDRFEALTRARRKIPYGAERDPAANAGISIPESNLGAYLQKSSEMFDVYEFVPVSTCRGSRLDCLDNVCVCVCTRVVSRRCLIDLEFFLHRLNPVTHYCSALAGRFISLLFLSTLRRARTHTRTHRTFLIRAVKQRTCLPVSP